MNLQQLTCDVLRHWWENLYWAEKVVKGDEDAIHNIHIRDHDCAYCGEFVRGKHEMEKCLQCPIYADT